MKSLLKLAAASVMLTAAACMSSPEPDVEKYKVSISAHEQTNPDLTGRASPTVVKILTLKTEEEFLEADFFDLFESPEDALGEALLEATTATLAPGEATLVTFESLEGAGHVAVVAGFKDLDNAVWRDIASVKSLPKERKPNITLADRTVAIEIKRKKNKK